MNTKKILTAEQVRVIENRLAQPYWGIQTELAREFGVSRNTIQRIQKGVYDAVPETESEFMILYAELKTDFRARP